MIVRIPGTSEVTTVMTCFRIQNPELNMTDWSVISRKVTEMEQTLAFSIDPNSLSPDSIKFQGLLGSGENYLLDPEG